MWEREDSRGDPLPDQDPEPTEEGSPIPDPEEDPGEAEDVPDAG
jgi:hypothetical protein